MSLLNGQLLYSGNAIQAWFGQAGVLYRFDGTINPAIPALGSAKVTLVYKDIGDLSGTRTFDGEVGKVKVNLTFDNGLKLEGDFNEPIENVLQVTGSGTWTTE